MKNDSRMICALQNNKLVYIDEVESGIKCNCYCQSCGEPLIARKGNVNKHHFSHKPGTECEHGYQTSLHLMAKDILANIKKITLPPLTIRFDGSHMEKTVVPPKTVDIEHVELEHKIGDIIPDIAVYVAGKPLYIEIFVTHAIDEDKKNKIVNNNIPVIEIDLSDLKESFDKNKLTEILVGESERKKWIHSSKQKEYIRLYQSIAAKKKIYFSNYGSGEYVNYCPIATKLYWGKPRARIFEECGWCEFFAGYVGERSLDVSPDKIYCNGRKKIDTIEEGKKRNEKENDLNRREDSLKKKEEKLNEKERAIKNATNATIRRKQESLEKRENELRKKEYEFFKATKNHIYGADTNQDICEDDMDGWNKLKKLKELYESGEISFEEYDKKRKEYLGD